MDAAREYFPDVQDQNQLITKYIFMIGSRNHYLTLKQRNTELRDQLKLRAPRQKFGREVWQLRWNLRMAQGRIEILKEEIAELTEQLAPLCEWWDEEAVAWAIDLTREKEANESLMNEIDYLTDSIASYERRIELMRQPASCYAPGRA
jgi:chromosome segregation ATPase